MKFKRIDVDTVRCIISEEELSENGLDVEDFLQNDSKAESFLRKIISRAEEEVGYKVQGGNVSIQVAVLPEHTLALTFSEKPDAGIANMLEHLKEAVENFAKGNTDFLSNGLFKKKEQATDTNKKEKAAPKTADKKDESGEEQQPTGGFALKGKNTYQFRFLSLDDVMDYAKGVHLDEEVENALYYLERESSYYLLVERGTLSDTQLCRLCSTALEFAEGAYATAAIKAYVIEHGKCIIAENAIGHLQEV